MNMESMIMRLTIRKCDMNIRGRGRHFGKEKENGEEDEEKRNK